MPIGHQPFVAHQLDLLRVEAGVRNRALRLLDDLQRDLRGRLKRSPEMSTLGKARLNALINQSKSSIEDYYDRMQGDVDDALNRVAKSTAKMTTGALESHFVIADISATLPSATFLNEVVKDTMILGAQSADWWERQAADVAFRFSNTLRQGITAGDTNDQIVRRISGGGGYPGIMDVSKRNARSLVHTSIQAVSGAARRATYQQNSDIVEGWRQVSTLDGHTTDTCIAYDGAEYDLDGEPLAGTILPYEGGVPRHWNCRSVEVPITKTFKELGIDAPEPDAGERASAEGPVDESTTFEDFLKGRSEEQQDEQLGAGRAEMWREGKITLSQLLDLKGNPMSLDDLKAKYED